jgi:branched-chain amino acid transport system permease protein
MSDTNETRSDGGEPGRPDGGETVVGIGRYFDRDFPLYRYRIPVGLVLLVVLLRPVVSHPMLAGYEQLATTMLIWMLFVSGFNLLFGFTGLLSFGHAMFLGFGMYAIGIGLSEFSLPFFAAAAIGLVFTAVVAYGIVKLIVNKGEIYFAMLTIAFGQAAFFIVNFNPGGLTEGSDGISRNTLPAWIESFRGSKSITFLPEMINDWYIAVAVVVFLLSLLLWQIIRSPFGRTLIAIRENDMLARSLGVNTTRYKVVSFVISALYAAVAGILLEINDQGAVLETLHWSVSGDAVLMSVLGGMNYFAGPFVGVFTWLFAEDFLTGFETLALPGLVLEVADLLNHWRFLLGLLILVIIISAPRTGLWGFLKKGATRAGSRLAEVIR